MKLSEKIMSEFNQVNHSYNLYKNINFCTCNVKTVHYGTNTLSYLGPKMWNFAPHKTLKHWKPFGKTLNMEAR